MKRNNLYIAISFVLASMWACTNDAPGMEQTDEEASRIYLSAGVGEVVSSRTPYHPTDDGDPETSDVYVPTTSHPLNVSVWASTTSDKFSNDKKNGSDGTVAIHTQASFQSGAPQLLGEAIYPKANENAEAKTVYFVGLHPKSETDSGWTPSDTNKDANFTFTGKEDVMFAPQISGTYGTAFEQSPQFHFHHLLTLLRIEMVADKDEPDVREREKVRDAWGKITSMTITSKNQITIKDLGSIGLKEVDGQKRINQEDFHDPNKVVFGGGNSLGFYCTDTDTAFPFTGEDQENQVKNEFKGVIPTSVTPVAYVMCAPVTGVYQHTVDGVDVPKPEYTLRIITEKRGTEEKPIEIPIDLKLNSGTEPTSYFTGSTVGKQFTILLNFKMGNVVTIASDVSIGSDMDWFTHGAGSGDLTEGDLIVGS